MKKLLRPFLSLLFCFLVSEMANAQMATNPFIWSDVPDPCVIRVGNNYYMSSTTMHMSPGVPIMKSTDLVNWEVVNYCYATMANTDALNLANGANAYGKGSWASSLVYNKGTYYVSMASLTTNKTYIYKTADIENGTWTVSVINGYYHDQSIFFDDDGKVYMISGTNNIGIVELTADASAIKAGGVNKTLITNSSSVAGSSFIVQPEGSHLQKINGNYYVSLICWPNGSGRTQLVYMSSTVTGTYTGKVVLNSNGVAQGGYVDTPAGKWYALLFQDNGSVGRSPDLVPVTWSNGWPTLGTNGKVPTTLDIPKGVGTMTGIVTSDEFSLAPPLKLQWQWNHNPQNNYWSLTQKTGYLRLTNERTDPNVLHTTNTLTQRTYGPKCSGYVALDVSGMKDGDYAGLLALQNTYGFVGVKMSGTNKTIVMGTAKGFDATASESGNVGLNQNTVYLRIDFDFTNKTDKAYFYYSLNGTTWTAIGSTLQMNYDLTHFMGYRFGLFSYATKSSGGYADFDYFRVGANITEAINSANNSPTTSISVSANTTAYTAPATINLTATTSISGGTISKVEFYNGTTKLGEDATSPYTYSWTNVTAGTYSITAVATDNLANKTTSSAISVKVGVPQGPYNGIVHPIPGTIQAEEYDLGGNGIAYMDDSPGSEVTPVVNYRTDEDVDIETCTDAGGGYNLGYTTTGEWLEYTVNVAATGNYKLELRVACNGDGRTLSLAMDGTNIATDVAIPNTTGWQTWNTTTVNNVPLAAGQHILRLTIGATSYININYMTFSSVITGLDIDVSTSSPNIYPNPFESDGLVVNTKGEFLYKIFNMSGIMVESGNATGSKKVGQHLATGMYVLHINDNKGSSLHKIEKK
jgi:beta-xylosidase